MKILVVLTFVFLGSAAFAQQSNEVKQENKVSSKKEPMSPKIETKTLKLASRSEQEELPLVEPGKKTESPVKKD